MEQFIRDKYERKIFMQPSHRASVASPTSVPTPTPTSAANPKLVQRYSEQLKSLKEMGFNDTEICLAALESSNGKVHEAVDYVLAHELKKPGVNIPPKVERTKQVDLLGSSFNDDESVPNSVGATQSTTESTGKLVHDDPFGEWTDLKSSLSKNTKPLAPAAKTQASKAAVSNPWASPNMNNDDDPFSDLNPINRGF